MFVKRRKTAFYTMLLGILFTLSAQVVFGQDAPASATRPRRVSKATTVRTIPSGEKAELKGNITRVGQDSFSVCDLEGAETVVQLTSSTSIKTHRRGILRGAARHGKSSLLVGLFVTVKGQGNDSGELVAKTVRFHDSNFKAATAVDTRAIPVEREQDRMAGQLDETTIVATTARKDARAAQESADKAQESADKAQGTADTARTEAATAQQTAVGAHEKIAAIDDFETTEELVVNFKAGSAVLTPEAKSKLDEFAAKTVNAKGYAIEISAFTSKEGGEAYNHRLSQARAEAVMDYLISAGKLAPRRMIPLYSGGENNPIADNKTRDGRMQNRRAEVKMLVSKGLAAKEPVTASQK
jgi:outer membrane protein OmpA-like peptidoglycan-associated protein